MLFDLLNAYASTAAIPIIGPAAAPAAMATALSVTGPLASAVGMTAMSGVGFMEGGYTGDGRRDEVAGPVHRGEFVFNSEATARIGVGTLEAMSNGKAAMISSSGGSSGGDSSSGGPAPIIFNAPVTVQAQPGMSEQQAQMQGESISAGLESSFGQFLDREMRQGGRLWRRN